MSQTLQGDAAAFTTVAVARTTQDAVYRAVWRCEPRRVSRRLPLLRGWSHDEAQHTLFT